MAGFDELGNWAIVSYNDDTGLGRMAEDARNVLGIGHQIVIPSRRLATKALREGDFLVAPDCSDCSEELRDFLSGLDGIIVLEKADWTAELLPKAKEAGLAVVAVPMWEWFRPEDSLWAYCDLFVCPNRKSFEVLAANRYQNAVQIPWALDLTRFPKREITGPARTFVHNAGLVDADDRKGTREVIQAFRRVKSSEVQLLVRMQASAELPELDSRIQVRVGNLTDPSELWRAGEVAIQPSKMEGIGFTVLEPICAGLPVITLDAPPMNEYPAGFLVKPQWFKRRAFASNWVKHAHLRLASQRHLTAAIEAATEMELAEISRKQRRWAEIVFDPESLRKKWSAALTNLVRRSAGVYA
jgi:glycosyltransferase involved in cell wall biosynthesis